MNESDPPSALPAADPASSPPAGAGVTAVEGPSFPLAIKALATLMVLALVASGWRAVDGVAWADVGLQGALFLLTVGVVVGSGLWAILTSRTSIDGHCIRQSWLWSKEVPLAQVSQVKLVHLPGLDWIFVPRLVVRSGGIGFTTFHAGDPAVVAAFRRLAYGEA